MTLDTRRWTSAAIEESNGAVLGTKTLPGGTTTATRRLEQNGARDSDGGRPPRQQQAVEIN